MGAKEFNEMVNFQSGLLGVSETSSDMRDLLEREAQDVRAAEAEDGEIGHVEHEKEVVR
jgi:acetate kinase